MRDLATQLDKITTILLNQAPPMEENSIDDTANMKDYGKSAKLLMLSTLWQLIMSIPPSARMTIDAINAAKVH